MVPPIAGKALYCLDRRVRALEHSCFDERQHELHGRYRRTPDEVAMFRGVMRD